jgi:chemotaxis protein methyltransferase CheR
MTGTTTRPTARATPGVTAAPLPRLSDAEFEHIRSFVRDRSAIVLDDTKQYLVQTRLVDVLRAADLPSFAALVDELRRRPHGTLAGEVVEAMTTNETSFFRDAHPFDAVTEHLVPALLERRASASLTVWCAACSSGQEPYSLAIALTERHPDLVRTGRVRIIATDVSPTMVERCRQGRFSTLEVNRGLPARHLVRHFEQHGRDWVASPDLRRLVDVRELNLTGAWTGVPRCEMVWLRNVLIYFSAQTKAQILGRLRREVLVPGGHLFLGASETTLHVDNEYVRREIGRSICYQTPEGPR